MAAPAQAMPEPTTATGFAAITHALDESARIPGTAWGVDPSSDQVVVQVDRTVDDTELTQIETTVRPFGSAVRVERVSGEITPLIHGGAAIIREADGARCSLGFNVTKRDNGRKFFLTAGHCAPNGSSWRTAGGTHLGPTVGRRFPGEDHALVRHDNNLPHPSVISNCNNGGTKNVNGMTAPQIGQWVLRAGSTTCGNIGQITKLNVTVNYPQGQVRGLFQANICAKPGDSGGSLLTGFRAVGLTSGGVLTNDPCSIDNPGGITFYEPVVRAMAHFSAMRIP